MDIGNLFQLMGLMPAAPINGAQPVRTSGISGTQLQMDGQQQLPTPGMLPIPAQPVAGAPIIPQTQPQQPTATQPHKGGFSTGNILSALLGSNFGQK